MYKLKIIYLMISGDYDHLYDCCFLSLFGGGGGGFEFEFQLHYLVSPKLVLSRFLDLSLKYILRKLVLILSIYSKESARQEN